MNCQSLVAIFTNRAANLTRKLGSRLKIVNFGQNCSKLDMEVDVDQKVNEYSQRPLSGPNGSKFDMGGPEGSIYPYLRVRP